MNTHKRCQPRRRQRRDGGAVLITVLLVMLSLLGLGITTLWLTTSNMHMGANTNMRNMALYVAEMGIELIQQDLNTRDMTTSPNTLTDILTGYAGAHGLDSRPTAIDADGQPTAADGTFAEGVIYRHSDVGKGDIVNKPFPDPTDSSPITRSGTSAQMGTYSVFIRNDTGELRQGLFTSDNNGTVVLRSVGVAPDGRTTVVLEVTIAPGSTPTSGSPTSTANNPVLCNAGKNGCDDNSSVQPAVVVE